ncbi:P-loop containing nucleoside triphosphate hydrolase protein [Xylaria sp. FL1777]|nr:P-loop containing nucleoside triphosphate hydrolase protein [Xylaria sp. FL1777]
MSVSIIYLTGATACGKGTLGKRLADRFNFYHVSMGDLRREHLETIRMGVPFLDKAIQDCVRNGEPVPDSLLTQYNTVPAVIQYHNHKAKGHQSWTTEIASKMLSESLATARARARSEGKSLQVVIVDGLPLTGGKISAELVDKYIAAYAGLTIVLETPREVAKERYLGRKRLVGDNADRFEARMELTDRSLPGFIEFMAERGEIVRSKNDETMGPDDAFDTLLSELNNSNVWLTLLDLTGNSR